MAQTSLAKFEPPTGVYIGGGTVDGQWQEFVNDSGKQPALRETFVYFPSDDFVNRSSHPEQSLGGMAKDGVTPVFTWQPQTYVQDIAAGKYDDYIRKIADECKAYGKPIFIRYAHEANGAWYDWSKYPDAVVNSSQRIYTIFQQEGATNVAFVWCPNYDSSGTKNWLKYYPGDAYVDWVGVDVYNWARWPRTFDAMVSDIYSEFASRKPIMIGEVSSAENFTPDQGYANPAAQNKSQWITDMFNAMNTKYPRIKAFVWFNVVKEDNWKISSSPSSLKAFQNGVANSRYLSKVYTGTASPTVTPSPSPTLPPSPSPSGFAVNSTHRWATYNNVNKPIEQFNVTAGTTITQSIYFTNIGTKPDSYGITISGIPAGRYSVSFIGSNFLNPGESRYANAAIKPTTAGTYTFTARVTSNNNTSVSASQTYTLYVVSAASPSPSPTVAPTAKPTATSTAKPPSHGVDSPSRWATYNNTYMPIEQLNIKRGTTVTQGLYIKNTGSVIDSYRVTVTGLPAAWYNITVYGQSAVASGDVRYGGVYITPSSSGDYKFTITVTSASDSKVSKSETYTMHVK